MARSAPASRSPPTPTRARCSPRRSLTSGSRGTSLAAPSGATSWSPVGFSATDEAVQYQTVMQVGMRLVERATGRVLHETKVLQESQDFGAETRVVITSSPHFQRGTIDGRDLANLTNVQIGEARRQAAAAELLDTLARDIYEQAVEGF